MDSFNLTEFLSKHRRQQLIQEDLRINTKYQAGKNKNPGKKFIPQHFDLKPRVLGILKKEGARVFSGRGILALPLDLYQTLNIKGNQVEEDIKHTFPAGKEAQASGLVSAIKKSLDKEKTMVIGGDKYYIINGTQVGDLFRIPTPYLRGDINEWEYEYEEDEMEDVENRLADTPDPADKRVSVRDKSWRETSGKDLTDLPSYRLNEKAKERYTVGRS